MTGTKRRRTRMRLPQLSTVILAVSVLAGIVGIGWGVDYATRIGAESLVARAVQHRTGVTDRPEVKVHGGVFIWQAVRGVYSDVTIDVHGLTSGALRIDEVFAEAHNIHLSLHEVLTRNVDKLLIDRTDETAQLTYADVNAYLKAQGRPVTLAPTGRPGEVRVTGTVSVFGRKFSASADAKAALAPGRLDIIPTSVDSGLPGLDSATRSLLGQQLTVRIPLSALPFGQHLTGLAISDTRITVHASGTDVLIQQ